MNNKDIDAQFLCKDCERYNLCEYYHRRRKDSYICKYFHLSVTPQEPKTGHWIKTGDYYTGAYGSIDYVECSCCHEESLEEGDYCPNCGCRMVEPQESEG